MPGVGEEFPERQCARVDRALEPVSRLEMRAVRVSVVKEWRKKNPQRGDIEVSPVKWNHIEPVAARMGHKYFGLRQKGFID